MNLVGQGVEEEPVDREVSALGVGHGVGRVVDLVGASPVAVVSVGSKCGDFDLLAAVAHDHDPELLADGERSLEQASDRAGLSARRDVVVVGNPAQESVPDAAPREIRAEARLLERLNDERGGG